MAHLSEPPHAPLLVIGVGASAGGLDAFEELLAGLGDAPGVAIAFVQHLNATGHSLLAKLLGKKTTMDIVEIERWKKIKPNTIYLAPPQTLLELKNGFLRVGADQSEQPSSPIDHFFHSIAEDQGELGIGVILSGAGSDGTLGLKSISDRGGLTFAQDAKSAKHDSMPRSAATTGVADHIMTPHEIGNEIVKYRQHLCGLTEPTTPLQLHNSIEDAVPAIADALLRASGHNFQHYKTNTLVRRIQRRMRVLKIGLASDYVEFLQQHQEEAQALFRELLIGVTAFFRDPAAFASLQETVLPDLLRQAQSDQGVRVWVAGCANGAEAYTLAIQCREVMDELEHQCKVQIFATDIDERALQIARTGAYPVGIEEHLTPERLSRFFYKRGKRYHVCKEIREMVLFSAHNLINDPPYSRQDLIVCRNLLIYLGPHLQNKLIPLFHYALRPHGYLFLGPSENISSHTELFRLVDAKNRISQRKGTSVRNLPSLKLRERRGASVGDPGRQADVATDMTAIAQRIVLDEFSPTYVVIDESGRILNASSGVDRYVRMTSGDYQNNIMKMAVSGLRIGLRAAIGEAKKSRRRVDHEGLSVRIDDQIQRIMLTVQPMPRLGEDEPLLMVVFHDIGLPVSRTEHQQSERRSDTEADSIIAQLEFELETTRNDLDRTLQDMEAANEELKSSNEELLSMNEELQSANEELETSKEEIRAGSDAVARANADLQNLLRSTQIATVFLDEDLKIRSFTPAISDIYELIATDVGRPLEKFVPAVADMPPLPGPQSLVDGDPIEHTVLTNSGKAYIRRVLPYRSQSGEPDGVVVTFTDVSDLQASEARLALALDATSDGSWDWDISSGNVIFSNQWIANLGYEADEVSPHVSFWESIVHPDDLPNTRTQLEEHFAGETTTFACEYRLRTKSGQYRWHLKRGRVVERAASGAPLRMVGTDTDIGDTRQARLDLEQKTRQLQTITDALPPLIAYIDQDQRYQFVNAAYAKQWGRPRAEIVGQHVRHVVGEENYAEILPHLQRALGGEQHRYDLELHVSDTRKAQYKDVTYVPEHDKQGAVVGCHVIAVDVMDRKKHEKELTDTLSRLDLSLAVSGSAVWSWDASTNQPVLNDSLKALFGFTASDSPRLDDFLARIHADDRERVAASIQQSLQQGGAYAEEYQVNWPSGETRWIRAVGKGEVTASGELADFFGVLYDFTDRKYAEQELADREAHLRRVINNQLGLVGLIDRNGDLLEVDDDSLRIAGLTRDDVIGRNFASCPWWTYDPAVSETMKQTMERAFAGETVRYDVELYGAGLGSPDDRLWIDFMMAPVRGIDGQVEYLIPSGVDISERKKIEQDHRQTAVRLEAIFNEAIDGIITIDRRGTINSINPAGARVFDYAEEELVGKNVSMLMPEPDRSQHDGYLTKYFRTGQRHIIGQQRELEGRRKDGTTFSLELAVSETSLPDQHRFVGIVRDITDRKRSQSELEQKGQRLSLALKAGGMAAWEWTPQESFWTPELYELIGVSPDQQASTEMFYSVVHPDDLPGLQAAWTRATEGNGTYNHLFRIVRPHGEHRWIRGIGEMIRDSNGNVERIFGLNWDETDEHLAAERLSESRQQLEMAMASARMGSFVWNRVTDEMTSDVQWYEALGVPHDFEPTGAAFLRLVHSDDLAELREITENSLTGAIDYKHEFRIIGPDGKIRWLAAIGNWIPEIDGPPRRLTGLNWDITEQKEHENAIRLSEERLRIAAGAAGFGTFQIDLDKNEVVWSEELKKLIGLSADDDPEPQVGVVPSFVHPKDRDKVASHLRTVLADVDEPDHWTDYRVMRPSGEVRHVRMQSRTLYDGEDDRKRIRLVIGTLLDITQQHKYEQSLRKERQLAQAANQAKSAFLANMSHEIRTPMTAILGYTDLLREYIVQQEGHQHLQTIRRNGDYLLEIINDILDLSKIEAGKLDIEMERFEPARIIEDVRSIMEVRAREGGLQLSIEYDGKLPLTIQSDAKRLKQILINLVGNAIKFTEEGEVKIRVHLDQQNEILSFEVTDTGIGMSNEQIEKLFKPFSQGDASVTRQFGGTGLGLAISQRLAELLGGQITVSSTPNVGSTFCVTIATGNLGSIGLVDYQQTKSSDSGSKAIDPDALVLRCHVLIVDDRRDIRFLSRRLLTNAGATVDEAEDGVVAVEYLVHRMAENGAPDIVLLDMQMPRLDGYSTARRLRELGYTGPIIALTADAMQGDMNECLEAGCNDYLSKPIDSTKLLRMVREMTSES